MVDPKIILDSLQWRYATKHFDPHRKVSDADLNILVEAMRLSPSSFGLQPWKFIVVAEQALKEELLAESYRQSQVRDCSHLIVLTIRRTIDEHYVDRYIDSVVATRQIERQTVHGYRNVIADFVKRSAHELPAWATRQAYLPLAILMQSAALLGIDTCPMEGIDIVGYDRVLDLGVDFTTAVVCPIGYRSASDKYAAMKKVRFNAEDIVEFR